MVTPDDKHVMITNRGHNSFCIFDRNSKTGLLKYNNHCFTGGQHPRSFDISPKGDLVVVSNQDDDRINAFKRNAKTG
jgi:6-phosphogluconolactonase